MVASEACICHSSVLLYSIVERKEILVVACTHLKQNKYQGLNFCNNAETFVCSFAD